MSLIIPVDLTVKRYYRIYVETDEGATDAEIGRIIMNKDLSQELTDASLDPSMDIERDDVTSIYIDHEGEWTE